MKERRPSFEIMDDIDGAKILQKLERCGRVCYKSEDKITEGSAEKFIGMILKSGHESVLEHEKLTVKFICDRGVTHEIVRHRIASYRKAHATAIIPRTSSAMSLPLSAPASGLMTARNMLYGSRLWRR